MLTQSSLRGPPPRPSAGKGQLGFPGSAQQPGLAGTGPAAAPSGSRKAFVTRAAGWEGEVLRGPRHSLPRYFRGPAKGAWGREPEHTRSSVWATEVAPHAVGPLLGFPAAEPLTCPVGMLLAPPGLPLQRSRPRRSHCPPRGPAPPAPLCPRPSAEAARATCRVRVLAREQLSSLFCVPGRVGALRPYLDPYGRSSRAWMTAAM